MMKWYRIFLLLAVTLTLTGCQETTDDIDLDVLSEDDSEKELVITNYRFSSDYNKIHANIKQLSNFGPYILSDSSQVRVKASFGRKGFIETWNQQRLTLDHIYQSGSRELDSIGLKTLVIVDLTLPQDKIDAQRDAIWGMRNFISDKNLYLAFMSHDGVTESYEASNYVMNKDLDAKKGGRKMLFRTILSKLNEVTSQSGTFADAHYIEIFIFSDGDVYQNDEPIDPNHFEIQEALLQKVTNLPSNISINYIHVADAPDNESDEDDETLAANIMQLICSKTKGIAAKELNWRELKMHIMKTFNLDIPDYELVFVNADHKTFKGMNNFLSIDLWDAKADTLITTVESEKVASSFLSSIFVNADSLHLVIFDGLLWAIMLLTLIYVLFQFIVPYISNKLFIHKYVHTYTGRNMSVNNRMVPTHCYYCKTPFEEGDEIVAKCEHVMHRDCWEENGYHCPEYGNLCKEGSHYYNHQNGLDPKNASFYLAWILLACVAGTLAWLVFICHEKPLFYTFMEEFFNYIHDSDMNAESHQDFRVFFYLPSYGLWISFFTTFCLSLLSVYKRSAIYFILECFCRALVAGIGGILSFGLVGIFAIVFKLTTMSLLLAWIPWILGGFVITYCISHGTRLRFQKRWVVVSLVIGLLSMSVWLFIYVDSMADYRRIMLFSHWIYTIGLAIAMARNISGVKRFFLRVEGPGKSTDVAIYKWLNANPNMGIKIGRSVDCQLQTSWGYDDKVAPVQCKVKYIHNNLCLVPLADGVIYKGQPQPIDKPFKLYHGTSFMVGNTKMTYIEKDI